MIFERFIAGRLYNNRGEGGGSRPARLIAVSAVAVGVVVMLLSVAIVTGFKREVSAKVIGFGGCAQILSMTMDNDQRVLPVVMDDSQKADVKRVEHVTGVGEYVSMAAMLKTDEDFLGVQLKGVGEDYDMSFFRNYVVDGNIPEFTAKKNSGQILLSQFIANKLNLKVGDKVFAYFLTQANGKSYMRARKLKVAAIYETHLSEYDRSICLTDIRVLRKLTGMTENECSGVEITVDDYDNTDEVVGRMKPLMRKWSKRNGFKMDVYGIREISPRVFSWLDVLDVNVNMIFILMIVVSGVTIVAGLLILMLGSIQMIGILKALGATDDSIRNIFQQFTFLLVVKGTVIGNVVGLGLCFLQRITSMISLDPSTYYIDTVPVSFPWFYIILINVLVLGASMLIIFLSSHLVSIDKPAKTMKFE